MALSKRSTKALCGIAAGAALLVGLAMSPALAGGAPAVADAAGGCSATGRTNHQWPTGQNVTVTVTNTAATPATKWAVTWQLADGQRIVTAWNAVITTAGSTVTAVNASWNGNLAPGASTAFGMQLSGSGPVPAMSCTNDAIPPTSPPPSDDTDVHLTLADNQRTLTVLVGQTIHVDLRSDFRPPTVSGPALSHVHTSGGYPTGLPMSAVYRAVAFGSVDVTTQTDHACHHQTPPCGAPILLWVVHINVVAPTDGRTVTVTTANNQGTVALKVGDTLVVSLPAEYQPPNVVPAGVLTQLDATGGYPTGRPFLARYAVTAPGEADLTSITDAACIHGPTPCPTPRIPWKVHATVSS
jgi:hypothetical protein